MGRIHSYNALSGITSSPTDTDISSYIPAYDGREVVLVTYSTSTSSSLRYISDLDIIHDGGSIDGDPATVFRGFENDYASLSMTRIAIPDDLSSATWTLRQTLSGSTGTLYRFLCVLYDAVYKGVDSSPVANVSQIDYDHVFDDRGGMVLCTALSDYSSASNGRSPGMEYLTRTTYFDLDRKYGIPNTTDSTYITWSTAHYRMGLAMSFDRKEGSDL